MKTIELQVDGYHVELYKSKIPGNESAALTFIDENEEGIALTISRADAVRLIAALAQFAGEY